MNLESKLNVYYIRDMPYEKTSTRDLENKERERFYLLIVLFGVVVHSEAVRDGIRCGLSLVTLVLT